MIYIRLLYRFLYYFLRAKTKYDIHSPFISEFIQAVLEDRRNFYAFSIIDSLRSFLRDDLSMVNIIEYGAGSKVSKADQRSISSLIKYSAVSSYSGKILFRTVQLYKPKTLLELGTSLGISTLYQAYAALEGVVVSIEGNPEVASKAASNFKRLNLRNIDQKVGKFDALLGPTLKEIQKLDFFFVDGNHTKKATLAYFEAALPFTHADSVIVFGDIYWSKEMEEAWTTIKAHPKVKISIDLFYLGIVFFRKEQHEKEHFTLVAARYKPWRMGFFN